MTRKTRRPIDQASRGQQLAAIERAAGRFRLTGHLQLPADIWSTTNVFKAFQAEADSRTGLFSAVLSALIASLGWSDGRIVAGLLVDFLNRYPTELRTVLAAGIIDGLGMVVRRDGDSITVDMAQLHDSLAGASGEKRTPGGLILPGR